MADVMCLNHGKLLKTLFYWQQTQAQIVNKIITTPHHDLFLK